MKLICKAFTASSFVLLLSACGAAPFVTPNPKATPSNGAKVVSMCYHANSTTREAIKAIAVKECDGEGDTVQFWRHDKALNDCPVLAKTRVSFICVPQK